MKMPMLALLVFWAMVTILASPSTSTAAIVVVVDGSAVSSTNCANDINFNFVLSGCNGEGRDYTTFTIRGLTTNVPAKVVAIDNTDGEELRLENALIVPKGTQPATCNASNSNYVYCSNVVFSRVLDAGPSASAGKSVTYYRKANGSLEKTTGGGATLSTFRVHGWVEDVTVGVEKPIGSAQVKTASSTSFTFSDSAGTPLFTQSLIFLPTSLLDDRELKGRFWFGFKDASHTLKLNYIKVYEPAGSGGGDEPHAQTIANDPSVVGEDGSDGSTGSSGCVPCCRMCPVKPPHPSRDALSDDADMKLKDDAKHQKN